MRDSRLSWVVSRLQLLFNLIQHHLGLWRLEDISWFPFCFDWSLQIKPFLHWGSEISIDFLLRLLHSCGSLLSNLYWRLGAAIIFLLSLWSIIIRSLRKLRALFQHLLVCSLLTQLCLLKFLFVEFNNWWQSLLVLVLSTFSQQICCSTFCF